MRKNIKFIVTFIIIILSITLGSIVYAKGPVDGGRREKSPEFAKQNEIKGEVRVKLEENRTEINKIIQDIKTKRDEFKSQVEINKEQVKNEISTLKNNFKISLGKIKSEEKRISTQTIVTTIQELNTKWTDMLSEKISQIETVLVSVDSRISKAEVRGLDVSTAKREAERTRSAISLARESILAQTKKVYEVNITDESTLKNEMKNLREAFRKDINSVQAIVKASHVALRDTATTLAKIPKIDEIDKTIEVEDNNLDND